jgi:hypothetical protein
LNWSVCNMLLHKTRQSRDTDREQMIGYRSQAVLIGVFNSLGRPPNGCLINAAMTMDARQIWQGPQGVVVLWYGCSTEACTKSGGRANDE